MYNDAIYTRDGAEIARGLNEISNFSALVWQRRYLVGFFFSRSHFDHFIITKEKNCSFQLCEPIFFLLSIEYSKRKIETKSMSFDQKRDEI